MKIDQDSTFEKTVMFEMSGKNQAIHEYDHMIWKLRIGYLGVFFGIWALLLDKMLNPEGYSDTIKIICLMKILGSVIAAGALFVDMDYVRRKYKVVEALNTLYTIISEMEIKADPDLLVFKDLLAISGTKSSQSRGKPAGWFLRGTGYVRESIISIIMYLAPLILLLVGFSILF